MEVNGKLEETAEYYGKVWGNGSNEERSMSRTTIAKGPGFMPSNYDERRLFDIAIKNSPSINWPELLSSNILNAYGGKPMFDFNTGYPSAKIQTLVCGIGYEYYETFRRDIEAFNLRQEYPISFVLTDYVKTSANPIRHATTHYPYLNGVYLNNLVSISTSSGVNWKTINSESEKRKKIYKSYNYRMNKGLEIGEQMM